jgi:hypothetical protein
MARRISSATGAPLFADNFSKACFCWPVRKTFIRILLMVYIYTLRDAFSKRVGHPAMDALGYRFWNTERAVTSGASAAGVLYH